VRKDLAELIPEMNKYLALGKDITPEQREEFKALESRIEVIRATPEVVEIPERQVTFRNAGKR